MGAQSRNKGKAGELEVMRELQIALTLAYGQMHAAGYPVGIAPNLQRNTLATAHGGCDIHGIEWAAIEVKRAEVLQLEAWWIQTLRQARKGQVPVLIYRQSHKNWRVRLPGALEISPPDVTSHHALKCQCEISFPDFLNWFRRRAMYELAKRHNREEMH